MKKFILLLLMILVFIFAGFAFSYDVKESKDISKKISFEKGMGKNYLEVDNVFGFIKVSGYAGNEVVINASKTIKGETSDSIHRAKQEVELEISKKGNRIRLYVDGPFRCEDGHVHWHHEDIDYTVKYDFELKVPFNTNLKLKTINSGNITVKNVNGDFLIKNVNGKITINEISGSGKAHTVNGKVEVSFKQVPDNDCSFKTINGNIKLWFPKKPSADFALKVFNGNMYSDYEFEYLPRVPSKGQRKNGRYVYKNDRFQSIKIGKGKIKIQMDTLNGNLYIGKKS